VRRKPAISTTTKKEESMLSRRSVMLFAVSLLVTGGCAVTASGPPYTTPPSPPPGYANVVIYRVPLQRGAANTFDWFIDGRLAVRLNNSGYSRLLVRAGQHHIHNSIPLATSKLKVSPILQAGRTYYFRDDHVATSTSTTWRIQGVPPEEAEAELKTYRFQTPVSESID
jgi:hypothetical protein